jgi:predicted extracellular nuclease
VYGGGGNAGSTYKNDFVEVFNIGADPVNLAGFSVQYASATGSSWQVTQLTGTLQPGHYFLVQEAAGTGGTTNLPTADVTGSINMSATAGKVALVNGTTALTVACPTTAVVDFVGFGLTANCFEGSAPTAAPSNTTAVLRAGGGCAETDSNVADFAVGAPNPRNRTSTANSCAAGSLTITTTALPPATVNVIYSATVTASGITGTPTWSATNLPTNLTMNTATGTISGTTVATGSTMVTIMVTDQVTSASVTLPLAVNATPTCTATPIGTVQGSGDASPLAGQTVTVQGVITAVRTNGFFMQDTGDGNPATSDGVFVFTSTAPTGNALLANLVCVTGKAAEFSGQTEIDVAATGVVALASSQMLPAPVVLTTADLNPNGPLDQLEKYSGMRVTVPSLTVSGPTDGNLNEPAATSTSNGNYYGVITGTPRPFREPGIALTDTLPAGTPPGVPRWDTNPQVIEIFNGQVGAVPVDVTAGAVVTNLTGVMSFFPSMYEILPDASQSPAPGVTGNVTFTAVPDKTLGELTIASTNMQHFYNTYQTAQPNATSVVLTQAAFNGRLNKASLGIRKVLKVPDIIALEEMMDLNTLQQLAAKVNNDVVTLDGGTNPNYQAYLVLGNDISAINIGFLVKSTVTVVDVTQYGKDTTITNPTSGSVSLLNDRPPLVLRALAAQPGSTQTVPVTVIAAHLRSLDSIDDPTSGPFVRLKRKLGAEFLADLIQSRQAADPNEKIVVLGDLNSYQFSDGYVDVVETIQGTPAPASQVVLASNPLVNPTLTVLTNQDPADKQYSYTFSGSAEELDHMILNNPAVSMFSRIAVGRIDADFPEIYRNDTTRPERVSDHDWVVGYFNLPAAAAPSNTDVTASVSITSTGLAYSRLSKQYSATVTITNTSGTALQAPLQLVLSNLTAGDVLANATGNGPSGAYITALATGSLAPGASVQTTIRISAPQTASPSYTPLVFSGTF